MDREIAQKIVEFIHTATEMNPIVCDLDGTIVAAHVTSRIGTFHAGTRKMLQEDLPFLIVTAEEEEASGGTVRAGINLPIRHNGELIGSIGIPGDPEKTLLVTRMASGLFSKELRERELLERLVGHAAQMDTAISTIVSTAEQVNASQARVSGMVEEVERLVNASFEDIKTTGEVVETIQSIASNTQMLGLNAAIEAAHAKHHGRGFAIVAEAVRKLSDQSNQSAEHIKVAQSHLNESMGRVVDFSKDLTTQTHEQTETTRAIAGMVLDLKQVSEDLMALTRD
ncbi:sugar diacid recognition domain-containing protein [Geothrix sp. 21YS21S-4]|uniref:sugar diacid recognition domain-containing protein n=1 Tax=Geothrix sp. 21YS21S-4 TaxID=3068889 RepID=UPI0027B8E608|nr:sugar diacid recognition domain-containing protein [Geothrix sp. 21YS21S-4]